MKMKVYLVNWGYYSDNEGNVEVEADWEEV